MKYLKKVIVSILGGGRMKQLLIHLSTSQTWHLNIENRQYRQFIDTLEDRKSVYTFVFDDKDVIIFLDKVTSIEVTDTETEY